MNARLSKLAGLIRAPALWGVTTLGVVPALEHRNAFPGRDYRLVIDAGANKGQFAAFAAWRWPQAELVCFEPLSGPRKILNSVLSRCAPGRALVRPVALGEEAGDFTIHVATREDSSSMRALGDRQRTLFSMEEARTETVSVERLDDALGDVAMHRPALLKIDVQGFEYELLKGAPRTLDQLDAVYVEVSYVELYEGQKLADDVSALLSEAGFEASFTHVNHYEDGAPVQADILFERTPS